MGSHGEELVKVVCAVGETGLHVRDREARISRKQLGEVKGRSSRMEFEETIWLVGKRCGIEPGHERAQK